MFEASRGTNRAGGLRGSGGGKSGVEAGWSGGAVSVRRSCCRLAGLRVPVPLFFGLLIGSVPTSRGSATSGGPLCPGIILALV